MLGRRFNESPFAVVVTTAREEALQRGDKRIGTEHLLLGLLHDSDLASRQVLGIDVDAAHAGLRALDREALSAVGVQVDDLVPRPAASRRTPRMTSAAAATLESAVQEAGTKRVRQVRAEHLLRALLARQRPDAVAELLESLGIDRSDVARRLEEEAG